MRLPDSELSGVPTCLYGGASGAVGLVASLPRDLYDLLAALQNGLKKVGACRGDEVQRRMLVGGVVSCSVRPGGRCAYGLMVKGQLRVLQQTGPAWHDARLLWAPCGS